jgi:hypothetical protein
VQGLVLPKHVHMGEPATYFAGACACAYGLTYYISRVVARLLRPSGVDASKVEGISRGEAGGRPSSGTSNAPALPASPLALEGLGESVLAVASVVGGCCVVAAACVLPRPVASCELSIWTGMLLRS